jgi:hypothetical protein
MAAEGNANDVRAHEGTYSFFTALMKWGTILSLLVGVIVVLIIAN